MDVVLWCGVRVVSNDSATALEEMRREVQVVYKLNNSKMMRTLVVRELISFVEEPDHTLYGYWFNMTDNRFPKAGCGNRRVECLRTMQSALAAARD